MKGKGYELNIKKRLYYKQFVISTSIVFLVVTILVVYFLFLSKQNYIESRKGEAEKIFAEITASVQDNKNTSDYLYRNLYRSKQELDDIIAYLKLTPEEYWKFRLDNYIYSNVDRNRSIQTFADDSFEISDKLVKLEFISYNTMNDTVMYKNEVFSGIDGKERLEELTYNTQNKTEITFLKEIRDPYTFKAEGCIIFTFENNKLWNSLIKDKPYMQAVISKDFNKAVYNKKSFNIWKDTIKLYQKTNSHNEFSYDIMYNNIENYQIFLFFNNISASELPLKNTIMIFSIGIAVFCFGVLGVSIHIQKLTKRVDIILDGMEKVKTGNLSFVIPVPDKRDELDMIAQGFNDMCEKLSNHINERYLAEIERKNAEMQAMQSQINPHFLYNTLEVIRMKAICNGDKEVGQMLYNMSVLFRRQLKDDNFITVERELDYARQYLELMIMRYPNVFSYEITCPDYILKKKTIKFILQPIVENYFIHGIKSTKQDNFIKIWVENYENTIVFHIKDNGRGMTKEDIEQKNISLSNIQTVHGQIKSMGIGNVNRRIKSIYGDSYGVHIQQNFDLNGIEVIIEIKESDDV